MRTGGGARRLRQEATETTLKRRGELVERSFAHCYETGGMRRCHQRGRENIFKRQLAHVSAFNLSLVMRQLLGAGTPRELRNRAVRLVLLIFQLIAGRNRINNALAPRTSSVLDLTGSYISFRPRCRTSWNSATCTTGCQGLRQSPVTQETVSYGY